MKRIALIAMAGIAMALPALASEASFDRTLTVKAQPTLLISTGSGRIHVTRGSDGQIHIVGHVKSNGWGSNNEAKVREIADHPPIEQTGEIIRVGQGEQHMNNISIDYEVQAPQNVLLTAGSGSGDILVEGVGENAKLNTGSGSIKGHLSQGMLNVGTGSGDIELELGGAGDVKANTGSGTINLKGVNGALRAETGSGDIHIAGVPKNSWNLQTGSGSVQVEVGNAPFSLDASTGSGGIHVDQPLTTQGSIEKDHVRGTVNGGGPTIKISTGSGGIHIH